MRTTTLASITLASCLAACAPAQDAGAPDPSSDNAALGVAPAATVAYVQNRTTQQANASFNVDGTGAVGKSLRVGGAADAGASSHAFIVQNDAASGSAVLTPPNTCVLDVDVEGEARLALSSDADPRIVMQPGGGTASQIWADPSGLVIDGPRINLNANAQVNGDLWVNSSLQANDIQLNGNAILHAKTTTYTVDVSQLGQGICAQPFAGYPIVDCTCPAGTFVLNGGGDAGGNTGKYMRENRQNGPATWRVTCAGGPNGATGDALCQTYSLTCNQISP